MNLALQGGTGCQVERQVKRRDVAILELDAAIGAFFGGETNLRENRPRPGLLSAYGSWRLLYGSLFGLFRSARFWLLGRALFASLLLAAFGFALLHPPGLNHVDQASFRGDRVLFAVRRDGGQRTHER